MGNAESMHIENQILLITVTFSNQELLLLFIYLLWNRLVRAKSKPNQTKTKTSLLSPRDGVFSAGHFHVMK